MEKTAIERVVSLFDIARGERVELLIAVVSEKEPGGKNHVNSYVWRGVNDEDVFTQAVLLASSLMTAYSRLKKMAHALMPAMLATAAHDPELIQKLTDSEVEEVLGVFASVFNISEQDASAMMQRMTNVPEA